MGMGKVLKLLYPRSWPAPTWVFISPVGHSIPSCCFFSPDGTCWCVGCLITGIISLCIIYIRENKNPGLDHRSCGLDHRSFASFFKEYKKSLAFVSILLPIIFLIVPHFVIWVSVRNLMKPLGTGGTSVSTKLGPGSSAPFPPEFNPHVSNTICGWLRRLLCSFNRFLSYIGSCGTCGRFLPGEYLRFYRFSQSKKNLWWW